MTLPVINEALSHSRAYMFNKCRKAYGYKYVEHRRIAPRDMRLDSWERMNRGILIHAGMEHAFLSGNAEHAQIGVAEAVDEILKRGDLSDEQHEALVDMQSDSMTVARNALDWLPLSDWEPVFHKGEPMVEFKLEMPLNGWGKGWIGYADLVARHKPTGAQYLIDYKARGQFEKEDSDRYNTQFIVYQKALATLGVEVVGSILFEIQPVPLSRGARYVRDDHRSLNGVRNSPDGRFRLTPTFRSQELVDNYWKDFEQQALVIAGATMNPQFLYRNMNSFNCKYCEFASLCFGELNGHDTEHVATHDFMLAGE